MKKYFRKLKRFISNLPILGNILHWSKHQSLPGFSKVPIYNVISFIIAETQEDDITTRANSIAFSFFLAIFPAIIFLFTLIPLLPFNEYYADSLNTAIESALPSSASQYLTGIINSVASIKREGLLSFGFFLSLFFASSGVLTLMSGFDKSYDTTFKKRSYLRKRGVALLLTLLTVSIFLISILFIVIGEEALTWVINRLGFESSPFQFSSLRYLFSILVIYIGITIMYRYGPSMYRRTKFINAGSILATILSILTSLGFSYFINNFGRYNELYGSIGALIIILLWLQFNAFILLLGFELNAGIAVNKDILYKGPDPKAT